MSETIQCGPLNIRKGDPLSISIYHLCNNPNEWIEPRKFIPERFNSKSKYYMTPNGAKRNPYSFSPFLGGLRICVGKTFAEAVSKFATPTLLSHFTWDFPEGTDNETFEAPQNNLVVQKAPYFPVIIRPRNLTYKVK